MWQRGNFPQNASVLYYFYLIDILWIQSHYNKIIPYLVSKVLSDVPGEVSDKNVLIFL